jgi:hypothetical protein
MADIAGPPNKRTSVCSVGRLSAAELRVRQDEIRTAITKARATYPLAASNLEWWLNASGKRRDVPLSEFDFRTTDCGLPRFLVDTHRRVIALGHRSGVAGVPAGALGIEGRLRLPASNRNSLQPGRDQTLDWQDSVKARMVVASLAGYTATLAPERDLSIALGGYTVHSRVTVRAQPRAGTRQLIEVVSWQVQVCDYYNWIVGTQMKVCTSAKAPIPIPAGVPIPPLPKGAGTVEKVFGETVVYFNDQWMAEVEAAGGARPFELYSEVFDAPADVRANFEAVNGMIRI